MTMAPPPRTSMATPTDIPTEAETCTGCGTVLFEDEDTIHYDPDGQPYCDTCCPTCNHMAEHSNR